VSDESDHAAIGTQHLTIDASAVETDEKGD
jgi:hypothetical protein